MPSTSRAQGISMTRGPLWKNIFLFSLPLIFSQLLQVMFNMADVAVVGRFASATALGSVGSTSILVTLFTGFLIGMGCGVNVCVAQHLGASQHRRVMESVHTALVLCTLAGLLIGLICFLGATPFLEMLNTKEDLLPGAVLYLQIYAFGMPALGLFNFGNAVLSASGDTRRPLLYLTVAGVLNIILNLVFVIGFHMAADGVSLASVISQYLSAGLILRHLIRLPGDCGVHMKEARIYPGEVRKLLTLGIPAGLQNAIFAFANLFIQVGVNSFDSIMVAGNAAAANADTIVYNVMAAFHTACSSFMGQNWGAGDHKRVMQSYGISLCYSFCSGAVLGLGLLSVGQTFLGLFTNSPEVVAGGMQRMRIMCWSYAISAFMDCTIAASRGIGKSLVPTVIVILGSCVFRVAWVYTVFAYFKTIPSLYLLYAFSWTITAGAEIWYFFGSYRRLTKKEAGSAA